MSNISYDKYRFRVRQTLGTISLYDLEGDFPKVLQKMKEEYKYYSEYTKTPHELHESNYSGGAYLDKTSKKTVIFDKIYLDCVQTGEDRELRVVGERDLTAEELNVLNIEAAAALAKRTEEEKEQLRKLREKYPDEH